MRLFTNSILGALWKAFPRIGGRRGKISADGLISTQIVGHRRNHGETADHASERPGCRGFAAMIRSIPPDWKAAMCVTPRAGKPRRKTGRRRRKPGRRWILFRNRVRCLGRDRLTAGCEAQLERDRSPPLPCHPDSSFDPPAFGHGGADGHRPGRDGREDSCSIVIEGESVSTRLENGRRVREFCRQLGNWQ